MSEKEILADLVTSDPKYLARIRKRVEKHGTVRKFWDKKIGELRLKLVGRTKVLHAILQSKQKLLEEFKKEEEMNDCILSYLKAMCNENGKESAVVTRHIEKLQRAFDDDTAVLRLQRREMESKMTSMIDKLRSEGLSLQIKHALLGEVDIKRQHVLSTIENTHKLLDQKSFDYREKLREVEKRVIQENSRIIQEIPIRIKELADGFLKGTDSSLRLFIKFAFLDTIKGQEKHRKAAVTANEVFDENDKAKQSVRQWRNEHHLLEMFTSSMKKQIQDQYSQINEKVIILKDQQKSLIEYKRYPELFKTISRELNMYKSDIIGLLKEISFVDSDRQQMWRVFRGLFQRVQNISFHNIHLFDFIALMKKSIPRLLQKEPLADEEEKAYQKMQLLAALQAIMEMGGSQTSYRNLRTESEDEEEWDVDKLPLSYYPGDLGFVPRPQLESQRYVSVREDAATLCYSKLDHDHTPAYLDAQVQAGLGLIVPRFKFQTRLRGWDFATKCKDRKHV